MKKLYIAGLAVLAASMSSCNDFLSIDPLDSFTDTPAYWSNVQNLQYQCNVFYNQYYGYGNGSSTNGWFYYQYISDDQINSEYLFWPYMNTSANNGTWNSIFEEARRAGYIIKGAQESGLSEKVVNNIVGIARLNRAWMYFQGVREFGDIQYVDNVMEISDEAEVYAARTNRDDVMDKVLEDINYACANITDTGKKDRFSKEMAYAMKSQICLWEGTFCKYRPNPSPERTSRYLQECVSACEYLLSKGYSLNEEYQTVYNSFDLSKDPEVIFYKPYSQNSFMHSLVDYTINTSGTYGISKDAFDSYLFLDGKPLATTTLDKNDAAAPDGSLEAVLSVRDKRLSQTIDHSVAVKGHPYSRAGVNPFTSYSGYGIAKFDNFELDLADRNNIGRAYTDAPLYWLPNIYLDYAEAKAELGNLSQSDLDNTVNKLQARAGLPAMTTNPEADPANNMGVSSLIWEIRRCRRCEFMCDNWFRYWDLIRWHQLELLDNTKHPNVFLGANCKNVEGCEEVLTADGYVDASNGQNRIFDNKYYLYPIPTGQIDLNDKLTQNPGW